MSTLIEQLYAEMQEAREAKRAAEFRADQAEYEIFTRAKYSADDKKKMLAKGQAMANANGDPSYPINDQEDLEKAIKAVGRGGSDHDAIRVHIMKRAKALNLSSLIPDNWNADGSLKDDTQSNSDDLDNETRDDKTCETCDGKGTILMGNRKCPDCQGSGKVPSDVESKSAYVPVTTWIDQVTREAVFNVNHEPGYRAAPEDAEDRTNARRVDALIASIRALPDEQREEAIESAPDPDEIRDALTSYNDIEAAVESALQSKLGSDDNMCDLWVRDAGDGWAVFNSYTDPPGHGTFKVTYDLGDDGAVRFTSEPTPVAQVTTYEPIPEPQAPSLVDTAVAVARDADMLALEREREAARTAEMRANVAAVRSKK